MQPKYIRIGELANTPARKGGSGRPDEPARNGRWPVSAATVWRWVAAGILQAPVRLGPQVSAWPIEVIESFEREQAQTPANSEAKAKAGAASVAARRARREQVAA